MKNYELSLTEMNRLVKWYNKNKRDLPWRNTGDAYDVWLSEIMLQQTRVEAVIPYFLRFKDALPTIPSLATVEEDTLLRLWEGLGYYNRVRNLQKCAQVLIQRYNSQLPQDYESLLSLPGIGPYTAGAIGAIAYGKPYAAVDGNVLRVLARYFGSKEDIRKPQVRKQFEICIQDYYQKIQKGIEKDKNYIPSFTQVLMELGALCCIPNGMPNCKDCPLKKTCISYQKNLYDSIPYRSSLKDRKIIHRTLFLIRCGNKLLIHKRPNKGLLANLYEFVGVDSSFTKKESLLYIQDLGFEPLHISLLPNSKHIFSHVEWHMKAYEVEVSEIYSLKKDYRFVTKKELQSLAIPSAFKTYLDYYNLRD